MISHAKHTFNFAKKEKAPAFIIITQKGQAILFFILHPFFVGRTEDRDVIFIFCKTPPFTMKDRERPDSDIKEERGYFYLKSS